MKKIKSILVIVAFFSLSGCMSVKSFVDPQYKNSSYDQIKPVSKKYDAKVEVEFQRNGKHLDKIDHDLKNSVEQVLNKTKLVSLDENASVIIKVTVNNLANTTQGAGKGFLVGLTFGAIGTTVQDSYDVSISLIQKNGNVVHKNYKHVIYATIGHKSAPLNVKPKHPADAFSQVVEDVMLNFIKDMQKQGLFS